MANRQIEIRVVNVSYTPATTPEDAEMVRAGISLLLKMMMRAKSAEMEKKDEVTRIESENNTNIGNGTSCSKNQISICEKVSQPEVTYAGVIGHNTSIDSLSA